MIRSIALLFAALSVVLPAAAQDARRDKDDIVVRGQRDKEVETFVRSLTESRDGRQVARWNGRICPKVVGLWPERATMITDRIAAVAKLIDVSIRVPPKCEANTVVAFTSHADLFTAKMIDAVPALITDVDYYGLPRRKQLARYLAPRAVRWFSINATTLSDGQHAGAVDRNGAGMAVDAAPNSMPASRITALTRENTIATLIVVDESKLAGIKWSQLADYLAMVAFAQPAIDADFAGSDSVMAIFAARDSGVAGPAGLTARDEGFIKALYRAPANLSAAQQRGVIADAVKKTPAR